MILEMKRQDGYTWQIIKILYFTSKLSSLIIIADNSQTSRISSSNVIFFPLLHFYTWYPSSFVYIDSDTNNNNYRSFTISRYIAIQAVLKFSFASPMHKKRNIRIPLSRSGGGYSRSTKGFLSTFPYEYLNDRPRFPSIMEAFIAGVEETLIPSRNAERCSVNKFESLEEIRRGPVPHFLKRLSPKREPFKPRR